MGAVNPFREVVLQLPEGLYGGDLRGFLQHVGLNGRRLGDEQWAVWANGEKGFVSYRSLAGEAGVVDNFEPLMHVPDPDVSLDDPETVQGFSELEAQLAQRMAGGDAGADLAAPFHQVQTDVLKSADGKELIAVVRRAYENMKLTRLEGTGEPAFPCPGVVLVSATDLLVHRAKLPAILFRFDQEPDALKTMSTVEDETGYFASSANWYREVIGVAHYLGPLLGCLTPGFWCLPTGR